jgi:uncharacterized membrane protein
MNAYGLWSLVIFNSLIFIIFAFSFSHPKTIAVEGPYRRMQHPQYAGFIIIMLGFLFQWPTILTALMFPVLVFMYARLARMEEREAAREFGETWVAYAAATPRWFPRLGRGAGHGAGLTTQARSNQT